MSLRAVSDIKESLWRADGASEQSAIPFDGFDRSLTLLRERYAFIGNGCRRTGSDVFETRLMLRRAICMQGPEAAEIFYHPDRFTRVGAIPITATKLLQGIGSVQSLDGEPHRQRKRLFLSLLTPPSLDTLCATAYAEWHRHLSRWTEDSSVVLYNELWPILTAAAMHWAGVPLSPASLRHRSVEFRAMIEGAGAVGPRMWRGLFYRRRCDRWATQLIGDVRAHRLKAREGSPLAVVAAHEDAEGTPLDANSAALELINLLRPLAAVSVFIVFAALGLASQPNWRRRIAGADKEALDLYVEEVRRLSPFFPSIAGLVAEPFEWRGKLFKKGTWVLLDLYGTNRHPASWGATADHFAPDRFHETPITDFNFIPQGGGDVRTTHRCPGEAATIELMKTFVRILTQEISYEVPAQDLSINLSQIPALPKSGFMMSNISRATRERGE